VAIIPILPTNLALCYKKNLTRLLCGKHWEKYTIWRGDVPNEPVIAVVTSPEECWRDRLMCLYCIVNRTTAKTHTTVTSIVRQINAMKELIIKKDSDFQAFNTQVQHLTHLYCAQKKQKVDEESMMTNLFDSYLLCKDSKFNNYIQQIKEE
jgi:hypothetical protein